MITPIFEVTQDGDFIIVIMKVPQIKATEADLLITENQFRFHAKPYFLRLTFSHLLEEEGRETCEWNCSTGYMTVRIPKLHRGEYFENLDMLTKLLEKKKTTIPNIEVIGQETGTLADDDWEVDQEPISLTGKAYYGFNNQYQNYFQPLQEEISELLELSDPESSQAERRSRRIQHEDAKFNGEHYMVDFVDDEEIQSIIKYKPIWTHELKSFKSRKKMRQSVEPRGLQVDPPSGTATENGCLVNAPALLTPATVIQYAQVMAKPEISKTVELDSLEQEVIALTEDHKEAMRRLPNREYLIGNEKSVLLGLLDIIYAYAYDVRTTMGSHTVESCWTICKIASTLSWLETFDSIHQTLVASVRRSLVYPLYRHWELSQLVLDDVKAIFRLGKRCLLRCLLDIKRILDYSDPFFHLSRLYMEDYCIWIQSLSRSKIKELYKNLAGVTITKHDVGWSLDVLEAQAIQKLQETSMQE